MKTLLLHYPVTTSMTVMLEVDDDFDPCDIDELQELVTKEDLVDSEVEPVEWDHLKSAWRYADPQDCWVTDPNGGYFTTDMV